MKNPGEVIRDRYKVLQLIAKGQNRTIYKVFDQVKNREVALKMLDDEAGSDQDTIKRVIKEGEVLAGLKHPAIVQFYSMEMESRTPFLVMEYLEGQTMKDLKEELREDLSRFFTLFLALLDGIEGCHQSQVYHRNLAPENLIITTDGQLKIVDFRFAKTREKLTRPGEFLGFSEYMAPEQCQGQKITEAVDIYALGVILWEFLVGEVPFPIAAKNRPADIRTVMNMISTPLPVEKLSALPRFAGLRSLVERMLDKEPKYRPTLREIVSTLKQEIPRILAAPTPA
jgi:serine/threonine-protein kinase